MKNTLVNSIISIINDSSSFDEKQTALRKERTRRRGRNRIVLSVIIDLLSKYSLPLHFEDTFSICYLDELTSNEYDTLLKVAHRSSCKYFKTVCFDIIWEHYHKIDLANKAMCNYFEMLKSEDDDYKTTAFVTAICRIYCKIKSKQFNIHDLHSFCIESLIPNLPTNERYIQIILKSLLLSSNSKILEDYVRNLIKEKEKEREYFEAIYLTEILVDVYEKKKRNEDKKKWLSNLAQYNEAAADLLDWDNPQSARRIIRLIQKAMTLWSASKSTAADRERKRLAKRIEPVKKMSLTCLKSFSLGKYDLTETMDRIHDITKNASFEKCLWDFSHAINLISPSSLEKSHRENGFIFSSLFATTVLDSSGRIKCIVPALLNSSPDEANQVWEHEAEQEYSIYADALISRYLRIIKEYFHFTEENLKFIVGNNVFVPEDRKIAFLKGLTAGFNYDYITALSILLPQVENAIRCLANDCGIVVYKTKDNGVEECLSLDSILKLTEFEELLDPTFLFNLKVFYTSDFGFGMRNMVSHGLMSDAELSSFQGLVVWWFTLYVCCIYSCELRIRLLRESKDNK